MTVVRAICGNERKRQRHVSPCGAQWIENFDASWREMNKAFLKRQEGDPDPDIEDGSADEGEGSDEDRNDEGSREDK